MLTTTISRTTPIAIPTIQTRGAILTSYGTKEIKVIKPNKLVLRDSNHMRRRQSLKICWLKYISNNEQRWQNQEVLLKSLEVQLRQLTSIVSRRAQGTLPRDTEKNPKDYVKAVTLRNRRELQAVP